VCRERKMSNRHRGDGHTRDPGPGMRPDEAAETPASKPAPGMGAGREESVGAAPVRRGTVEEQSQPSHHLPAEYTLRGASALGNDRFRLGS
jgi:hypothetical protein